MITIETIRIKVRSLYINITANLRGKKIKNKDITIISNNCWSGFIYQSYNLKYNSPTIGLFFMPDDYIKFLKDIKKWIYEPIEFIDSHNSKYYSYYKEWNKFGKYPIGKFKNSDIEIHFLHYVDKEDAVRCWDRRVKRINWNKILYKFNDQNLCTNNHIKEFCNLEYKNKICFTHKEYRDPCVKYIKIPKKYSEIQTSYEPFGRSTIININEIINNL